MKQLEINTKLEEELKECTFSPNRVTKKNEDSSLKRRSFEKVYSDI
jgi:hypothetical protein